MERSILFLLPPGFADNDRREFCPECAELWGVIHYFPAIRETLDIRYAPLGHPRDEMVAILGEGRWNCPTMILAEDAPGLEHQDVKNANGRRYLDSARAIARYFAAVHGTPFPRGG
jgi:hypothetical protein